MKQNTFDSLVTDYEAWFIKNKVLFQTELLALKKVIPNQKKGIEIGIGSGIFAEQLGIKQGIDPSEGMLEYAKKRGLDVQPGVAEDIPFDDESFDFTAFITSICFINNPQQAINEAYRILKKDGEIIIAIIDKATSFGKFLHQQKDKSKFYKHASFFTADEIIELLENNSFKIVQILQTLENPASTSIEDPKQGHGKGSFVVIKGVKK
ncbi:MAG: class I SAM-dependent methyltransferase [Marinilabiliaceae bacterium]|nr:class I SAM-dependent methyltransferase [Marinilabiliaceae bacterium]